MLWSNAHHHSSMRKAHCMLHFNSRPAPGTPKQALPGGEGPPTYRFRVNNLPKICQVIDRISLGSPPFHINSFFSSTAAYNSNFPISFRVKETLLVNFLNQTDKVEFYESLNPLTINRSFRASGKRAASSFRSYLYALAETHSGRQ